MRLGYRSPADFGFFPKGPFDPDGLAASLPFLSGAERIVVAPIRLTCRVERGGPDLISFFGALGLGEAALRDQASERQWCFASLLDLVATQAVVVQKRAEASENASDTEPRRRQKLLRMTIRWAASLRGALRLARWLAKMPSRSESRMSHGSMRSTR